MASVLGVPPVKNVWRSNIAKILVYIKVWCFFCLFVLLILAIAPVGGIIHCDRFRWPPVYLSELDYVRASPGLF